MTDLKPRCGRPSADGDPCRQFVVSWPQRHDYPADPERPRSCGHHLTDAERKRREQRRDDIAALWEAESRRLREEAEARRAALWTTVGPRPPACWAWPVSPQILAAAAAASRPGLLHARACELAWVVLRDWQAARCAVCGTSGTYLHLDHAHDTGLIRGWLHPCCNQMERNPESPYALKNPAVILGIRMRYADIHLVPARVRWPRLTDELAAPVVDPDPATTSWNLDWFGPAA